MFLLQGMEYFYYIALPLIGLCIAIIIILIIVKANQKKRYFSERKQANNLLIEALGGRENIIKATANGSRLALVLNDYSKVNEIYLKEQGVSSIIKMSNKITLVIGQEAKEICDGINSNNDNIRS